MTQKEKNLFIKAQAEIADLRADNKLKSARLSVFDDIMILIRVDPPRYGMEHREDVFNEITKHLMETKVEEE